MSSEYQFVRISEDNLADFAALGKDAFGVASSAEENKALFDTKAFGKEYIGYLAYSADGEPAAFYGVFPCFVEYNGERFLAAQSGSTMTHSKHRKKGLFYKLGVETFDLARREGINFVYGFPNTNSYPGLKKLGWQHHGSCLSYHVLIPTLPFAYLAQKLKFLQPLFDGWFKFITGFWRTESRPFPSSAIERNVGAVSRSQALLDYKKDTANRFMLNIGGRMVWINQQYGKIGIGDIELVDDQKDFKKVLRTLKLICFLCGVFHLRTYTNSDSRLDRLFKSKGYQPRPALANCYLNLSSDLPLENFKYNFADYDTF